MSQLIRVSVLAQDEVSTIDVVLDETIGLRTGIRERLCSVTNRSSRGSIKPHLHVMLVTKRVKFLARWVAGIGPPLGHPQNELPPETVYQWKRAGSVRFGAVPSYLRSYASGVWLSRAVGVLLCRPDE